MTLENKKEIIILPTAELSDTALNLEVGINFKPKLMLKRLFQLTLLTSFILLGCKKATTTDDTINSKELELSTVSIKARIISTNPLKLSSPQLVEKVAKIKDTDITTYGYVLAKSGNQVAGRTDCWSIETGYFFYGRCAVYGTLFSDCSGNTLFTPCGFGCTGFGDICPPDEDEWWARQSSERFIELKFPK
ncbi:MAG: hypothetical protein HEQ40_13685 [Lacibacter sp.]|jgi:hypothetical protein